MSATHGLERRDDACVVLQNRRPRVLIGGVGYRWMRDASFGLIASDELERLDWPPGVEVADLGYGALYVAQDLADAQPPYGRLILLAGVARGREPGKIYRYQWKEVPSDPEEIQARIREAGAGVIGLDHLLVIAQHFRALPDEVIVIEIEPVDAMSGDGVSPEAARLLPEVIEMVRREAMAYDAV
ncbi:MAG: hydrogenase maturation protease [Chloroflexota bacterium]|nr:hydrogenase maturation protease [Chloroflexota bacterium]